MGQSDYQVQIRGNRVEPGEIEGTLTRLPAVTAAAAALVPRPGDHMLMAASARPARRRNSTSRPSRSARANCPVIFFAVLQEGRLPPGPA
ncbi:hypothetical protein AB0N16_37785 [Streptomyces sp. NPDC051105]|uniref:hypothetical protein n=1 Tax=Streptomyces sp. NPDC051105 TaxID=3154843 RepID=UPI00343E1373